jgi:hypothetical protein
MRIVAHLRVITVGVWTVWTYERMMSHWHGVAIVYTLSSQTGADVRL